MELRIGNTAQTIAQDTVEWGIYVDAGSASPFISDIAVELHPTFKQRVHELTQCENGRWESTRFQGWGTFPVAVTIKWKAEGRAPTIAEHTLSFQNGGGVSNVAVVPPDELVDKELSACSSLCLGSVEAMEVDDEAPAPSGAEFRARMVEVLQGKGFLSHDDPAFFHGRGYAGPLEAPGCTWASDKKPRNDHDAPEWLTASEFTDSPEVMRSKVKQLAELMRASRKTVIYSGAGISKGAGIGQAARGSGGVAKIANSQMAMPTPTHYALGALAKAGLIQGWVQQNHDGLPQKAGFPQEDINEIHGSWYDPSNPVVKYSGTLKEEQYPWMQEDAQTADLVLVLGTSLGGLNADQVATNPAHRSVDGDALGTVMINLQQTAQDGKATLRLFGKSDMCLELLLLEFGLKNIKRTPATFKKEAHVLVPYDKDGKRTTNGDKMWLDLRDNAKIKLTPGHNVQGAQQPAYMHIGAKKPITLPSGAVRKNGPGHGSVIGRDDATCSLKLNIEGVVMTLGQWWIEAAMRGGPASLPVVNIKPRMAYAGKPKN